MAAPGPAPLGPRLATSVAVSVMIAITAIVSPMALGMPESVQSSAAHLFKAPFVGSSNLSKSIVRSSPCGSATAAWSTTPHFSVATGVGRMSGNGTAVTCSSPSSSVDVQLLGRVGFEGSNFSVKSGGWHWVAAKWNWSFSATVYVNGNANNSGYQNASFIFTGDLILVDLTAGNRTSVAAFASWYGVYAGGASLNLNASKLHSTLGSNVVLTAGHVYAFCTVLQMGLSIHLGHGPRSSYYATAFVAFNMATGGEHARLVSLLVR